MLQEPYALDNDRRAIVLTALIDRCVERRWALIAAQVRSTHVHVIVVAEVTPERVMNHLKAFASRRLNLSGFDTPERKR